MKSRNYSWLLVFVSLVFISPGCDLLDDSPCGPKKTYDLYLLGFSCVEDVPKNVLNTYMEGNNRVLQWGELVDHVCTDEHVSTEFRVGLLDETTSKTYGITARGRVSWQFLYENKFPCSASGPDLKSTGSTGLKQAFPDLNGWCVPVVEVIFPTKGSYSADTAFIKQLLISVEITAKYREYK